MWRCPLHVWVSATPGTVVVDTCAVVDDDEGAVVDVGADVAVVDPEAAPSPPPSSQPAARSAATSITSQRRFTPSGPAGRASSGRTPVVAWRRPA